MRLVMPFMILLAACAQFPELEGTVAPKVSGAGFPDLVPLAPLVARASANTNGTPVAVSGLTSRLATLRARSNGLRGPVIPAAQRARMLRGIS